MGKLIKMDVIIVGMRGLGVEIAKNLALAGPKSVSIYDPEIVKINDLGANFYCEQSHVGKKTRAEASITELQKLNPYVKVEIIKSQAELDEMITSGRAHVVCQTEMLLNGEVIDQQALNDKCRAHKVGYIASQTLGPWGYGFVDFGNDHIITDHDGEATKSFIVTMIEKGETTRITVHEDKRHIY